VAVALISLPSRARAALAAEASLERVVPEAQVSPEKAALVAEASLVREVGSPAVELPAEASPAKAVLAAEVSHAKAVLAAEVSLARVVLVADFQERVGSQAKAAMHLPMLHLRSYRVQRCDLVRRWLRHMNSSFLYIKCQLFWEYRQCVYIFRDSC